jgi:hypothetical protein
MKSNQQPNRIVNQDVQDAIGVSSGSMNPSITKVSIGIMSPLIGMIRLLIGGTKRDAQLFITY